MRYDCVVMRPRQARPQEGTLAPTLTAMRSAVSGWHVRDGIAFLALIVVYRFKFITFRRLILAVTAVVGALATYVIQHPR